MAKTAEVKVSVTGVPHLAETLAEGLEHYAQQRVRDELRDLWAWAEAQRKALVDASCDGTMSSAYREEMRERASCMRAVADHIAARGLRAAGRP